MLYLTFISSPLGELTLISNGEKLTCLWFEGQTFFSNHCNIIHENDDLPVFILAKKWLQDYFDGKKIEVDESLLSVEGSLFQRKIWEAICKIPYGQTTTYSAIARIIAPELDGRVLTANIIGNAVRQNPLSIIVPTHRVIAVDDHILGYPYGVDKKIWLLEHEGLTIKDDRVVRKKVRT